VSGAEAGGASPRTHSGEAITLVEESHLRSWSEGGRLTQWNRWWPLRTGDRKV